MRGKRKYLDAPDVDHEGSDEEDVTLSGRRQTQPKKDDPIQRSGQKRGLEAEDEYGLHPDDDAEGEAAGEDEQVDSEYEESDDGAGDDYNAENYFDAGEDDDFDDGGAGEEGVY